MALRFFFVLVLFLVLAYYSVSPDYMDDTSMVVLLSVLIVVIGLFSLRNEPNQLLKGQHLKHSTLFLTGLVVVHFQSYIDFLIGNISQYNSFIWVNNAVVVKSMSLSLLGVIAFCLGYLLNTRKTNFVNVRGIESGVDTRLLTVSSIFFLVLYFATVNPLYFLGFYGSVNVGTEATFAVIFLEASLFALIVQHCRNLSLRATQIGSFWMYVKSYGLMNLTVLFIYLASVMVSGDRGPLMIFGIAIFSSYVMITRKKISLVTFLLLLVVSAQVISLLGDVRNQSKGSDFLSRLSQAVEPKASMIFDESSFSTPTQELALSVRALHRAVDYVPERHDYLMGRFQFQQIVSAVPFVSNIYPHIFEDVSYRYRSSPSFITWIRQGDDPWSGDGTTCVADLYLDFGIVGVVAGMMLFGYMIRHAELSMYSGQLPTLLGHVFLLVFLSKAIYISRASLLVDFKGACWTFAVLWVNFRIVNRNHR
jgi:hypothetical protein